MFVRFLLPADPPDLPVPLPSILLLSPIGFGTAELLESAGWVAGRGAEFSQTDTILALNQDGSVLTVTVDGAPLFIEPSADASSFEAWVDAVTQFGGETLLVLAAPDEAASMLAEGEIDAPTLMGAGWGTFARFATAWS